MNYTIVIERVDHIGIRVRNLETALNFCRAPGFNLLHRASGDDIAIVRNENGVELNLVFNTKRRRYEGKRADRRPRRRPRRQFTTQRGHQGGYS